MGMDREGAEAGGILGEHGRASSVRFEHWTLSHWSFLDKDRGSALMVSS